MIQLYSPAMLRKYLSTSGMPPEPEMTATPHFKWIELLINQKELPGLDVLENLLAVAKVLEIYKEKLFYNLPITITSGWRSQTYNEKIGGAKDSQHILGKALDFTIKGFSSQRIYDLLDKVHFGGLELAPTWTHMDIRGKVERFDNNNKILASHYDLYNHNVIFGA